MLKILHPRILLVLAAIFLQSSLVLADAEPKPQLEKTFAAPHQAVNDATSNMIDVIQHAKTYYETDPDKFYVEVNGVMEPLIDFRSFARSVMGKYGSKRYYSQLSDEQKSIYKKEFARFVVTFKDGLIRTYGKGLLAFNGQKIELQPASDQDLIDIKAGKSVDVIQYFYGSAEKPYVIRYKMRYNKKSQKWLLRNVTIESINVGKVYRGQFETSMNKYKEDLSQVIDNWTVKASGFSDEEVLDKAAGEEKSESDNSKP